MYCCKIIFVTLPTTNGCVRVWLFPWSSKMSFKRLVEATPHNSSAGLALYFLNNQAKLRGLALIPPSQLCMYKEHLQTYMYARMHTSRFMCICTCTHYATCTCISLSFADSGSFSFSTVWQALSLRSWCRLDHARLGHTRGQWEGKDRNTQIWPMVSLFLSDHYISCVLIQLLCIVCRATSTWNNSCLITLGRRTSPFFAKWSSQSQRRSVHFAEVDGNVLMCPSTCADVVSPLLHLWQECCLLVRTC